MPTIVDPEKCDACEDCIEECPTESISLVDGKALINHDDCIDCEACLDTCPNGAISMVDE
jgi:NAD-dependent dihydropyrimidine dehydrogenase PreA subunit